MAVLEKSRLLGFLEEQTQKAWNDALDEIESAIHPVDRRATRIWFAFWPLDLKVALASSADAARLMDLEGRWKLEEQIDSSVCFLYGARFWPAVKNGVLAQADADAASLADVIRRLARSAAEKQRVDMGLVLGIAAVGLMTLRQVGAEAFEKVKDAPADGPLLPGNPERVVGNRKRKSGGLVALLKGVNRSWEVRWDERDAKAVFNAITGQDLAMAGATDKTDYRGLDYRRVDGPLPVECRVGSCGYCWVGVLSGRENLSPITDFERGRLTYFGYDTVSSQGDSHPPIRLSCQAQCHGDVTVTVPPWNGELNRRHDEWRKKMGTA